MRRHTEISGIWRDFADDPASRVAVITGTGDHFWTVEGTDGIEEMFENPGDYDNVIHLIREGLVNANGIVNCDKPIISPAVHRLALEMTDRQATALAEAISDTSAIPPEIAKLQGMALASAYAIIISEAGQRTREGQQQQEIADELYPLIERVLDELDRWFTPPDRAASAKRA